MSRSAPLGGYRSAIMDHCVAFARDADPDQVQRLAAEIANRKRT